MDLSSLPKEKLDKLREEAQAKFSKAEIESMITMGKTLCSKPVLTILKKTLEAGVKEGENSAECVKLCKKIDQLMPYNYCGFVSLEFEEITHKLHICLSMVPRDHVSTIDLPAESYIKQLYEHYDNLKRSAVAYWHTFMEQNKNLMDRIAKFRPDIDFSKLLVDDKHFTTMYWDVHCNHRIGIFSYYVDKNGTPFYKKSDK